MGNFGFQEMIVVFLIALLVFGPKKLPELGKSLGKGLKEFKRATEDIKSNWDDHMKDVEKSVADVKNTVNDATKDIPDMKSDLYSSPSPTSTESKEESNKEVHQA